MASTAAAPPPSFSLLLKARNATNQLRSVTPRSSSSRRRRSSSSQGGFRVSAAAQDSKNSRQRAPPGVDTRIHWDNPDEGWIGGSSSKPKLDGEEDEKNLFDEKFADLLNDSSDSHYQYVFPVTYIFKELIFRILKKNYSISARVMDQTDGIPFRDNCG